MSIITLCDFCKTEIKGEYRDIRISQAGLDYYHLDTMDEQTYDACTTCVAAIKSQLEDWKTSTLPW